MSGISTPPASLHHASIADYNPFSGSLGPVHASLYVQVERVLHLHQGEWIPCFRKSLISAADKFREDKFRRELRIAAQTNLGTRYPWLVQHAAITRGFETLTMDAGPSLNLWRQYRLQPLDAPGAAARPLITPRLLVDLLITLLQALQQGIHAFQGLHCDLHAGNICIPFERHPTRPQAIRPRIEQLRLIDLGNAVTPGESRDMGPLEIDPDAPNGRSERFSPALRAALRQDHRSHTADGVHRLDARIDLFALGWLGQELSQGIDAASWDAEPASTAAGWPQALNDVCQALLAQDSDGSPLPDALHQRFITPLQALRQRLGPAPAEGWWLPQRLGSAASPRAPVGATDTPIPPWAGDDSATPVVPGELALAPVAPAGAAAASGLEPDGTADAEPVLAGATPVQHQRPARRQRSLWPWAALATLGLGAGGGWWLGAGRAGGDGAPVPARAAAPKPSPGPTVAALPARAPTPAPAPRVATASAPAPGVADRDAPRPGARATPAAPVVADARPAAKPPNPTANPTPNPTANPSTAPPAPRPAPAPAARIEDRLNTLLTLASDGQWARADALLATLPATPAPALRPDLRRKLLQGEVEVRALHYDNAEGLFEDVTHAVPQHGPAWKALGYAQMRQGRHQRARNSLAQALRLLPGDDGGWAFLSEVLAAQGQADAASAALQLAVYLARDRPAALQLLRHDTRALQHSAFQRLVLQMGARLDKLPPRPKKP